MAAAGGHRTHYALLGVSETADLATLRTAYRSLAREAHPDSGGEADRMLRLNEAWHVLQDPGRRAAYDRQLADQRRRDAGPARSGSDDGAVAPEPPTSAGPHTPAGGVAYGMSEGSEGGWSSEAEDVSDAEPPLVPVVEGWLALLPPAGFVLTVALSGAAFMFASPALMVFSGAAGLITVGLFVLVPLRALLQVSARSSGTPPRPREE